MLFQRSCPSARAFQCPDFRAGVLGANIRWVVRPVLLGAEPLSHSSGDRGVLVLHGFTGSPQSMRPLAERFVEAGFSVEMPLLPGHGTDIEDLLGMRWQDWSKAADDAYLKLAEMCRVVAVVGLSMGGSLACRLAADHHEIAGVVLINPFVEPPAESFREILQGALAGGAEVAPAVGSDIARPAAAELSYPGSPLAPALSLFEGLDALVGDLHEITCPILLMTSREDHVVPTSTGEFLMERVTVPLKRVWLERSYHVATLDYDRDIIESEALDFVLGVLGRSISAERPRDSSEMPADMPAGGITVDAVAHVARLARLQLTSEELQHFTVQLGAVLQHAAEMAELDISGVDPMSHPLPVRNVMRPDDPRPGLDRDEVLSEAPLAEDGKFRVPRILGVEL